MRINIDYSACHVTFDDLNKGDVFRSINGFDLYLKINMHPNGNAYNLTTDNTVSIKPNQMVRLINCELVVKE